MTLVVVIDYVIEHYFFLFDFDLNVLHSLIVFVCFFFVFLICFMCVLLCQILHFFFLFSNEKNSKTQKQIKPKKVNKIYPCWNFKCWYLSENSILTLFPLMVHCSHFRNCLFVCFFSVCMCLLLHIMFFWEIVFPTNLSVFSYIHFIHTLHVCLTHLCVLLKHNPTNKSQKKK